MARSVSVGRVPLPASRTLSWDLFRGPDSKLTMIERGQTLSLASRPVGGQAGLGAFVCPETTAITGPTILR